MWCANFACSEFHVVDIRLGGASRLHWLRPEAARARLDHGLKPVVSIKLLFSRSPISSFFERLEWNTDGRGSDGFTLIAVLGVHAVHASIDAVSALPPLERQVD
ncbi:MAG: hypothetical protein DWQ45_15740 [Planctomycetota bacterium]|nr:MAG: hypothetical protein DWQ29_08090 [Planctomycetota bacterium]REK33050.1 MAG: hypothetical protein DWQ45_15740 [Planctomycetota bacterium]